MADEIKNEKGVGKQKNYYICSRKRKDAGVVELARLESE